MKIRAIILGLSCVALGACTTVNMTELPSPTTSSKQNVSENVVVKASDRLEQQFSEKGWIEKSQFHLKQAAMTLLKGRIARQEPSVAQKYADQATPTLLKADITEATYISNQTFKAAEVYLEYADKDADLSKDLKSLEKALLNCRQAEATFVNAAGENKISIESELAAMGSSLQRLQTVTDKYGVKVRAMSSSLSFSSSAVN